MRGEWHRTLAGMGALWLCAAPAAGAAPLRGPFPGLVPGLVPDRAAAAPRTPPACDAPPAPLVRLATVSKYRQDDPTRSRIDPKAEAQFRKDIAPLERMTGKTVRYANRYLLSGGKKVGAAHCALHWLHHWAAGQALREIGNDKAFHTIGKYLGGMALAYLQIQDAPGLKTEEKQRVALWLAAVADALVAFHDDAPDAKVSRNNHRYWSGLGVAAAGVAAGRRDLLDWGMESARIGLRQVAADGTLPMELARKNRARDYHLYAVTPLVMLAEIGLANGVDLYAEEGGALRRLAHVVAATTDNPEFFVKKTGYTQLPYPDQDTRAARLSWMEPYQARFPDPAMERILAPVRPVQGRFIGGQVSLIYAGTANNKLLNNKQ